MQIPCHLPARTLVPSSSNPPIGPLRSTETTAEENLENASVLQRPGVAEQFRGTVRACGGEIEDRTQVGGEALIPSLSSTALRRMDGIPSRSREAERRCRTSKGAFSKSRTQHNRNSMEPKSHPTSQPRRDFIANRELWASDSFRYAALRPRRRRRKSVIVLSSRASCPNVSKASVSAPAESVARKSSVLTANRRATSTAHERSSHLVRIGEAAREARPGDRPPTISCPRSARLPAETRVPS